MNVSHRDGKPFVEVEIPQGKYCDECPFYSDDGDYGDICNLLGLLDEERTKHKDCPSLKEGEKV